MPPTVSFVTVTYDAAPFLPAFAAGMRTLASSEVELIAVDNASRDGSAALLRATLPWATVVEAGRNLGFAGGCNVGASRAVGEVLFFINPDTRLLDGPDDVLKLCRDVAAHPEIGAAGCKLVFPDGRLQSTGGILGPNGVALNRGWGEPDRGQYDAPDAVDYVSGAAFVIRRACFEAMGGFHAGYFPGFYEETELCVRLRQRGLEVRYFPRPRVAHHESPRMSRRGLYWLHRNRMLFVARNPEIWSGWRTELAWLRREHLDPIRRALVGLHPWKLAETARRLPPVLAGSAAGWLHVQLHRARATGVHE